jgi:predicted aspartyl protease
MGHVFVDMKVSNPQDESLFVEMPNALVDTGATWTTIPAGFAPYLHLVDLGPAPVRTASGSQELRQSYARVEIEGKFIVTNILLSETVGRAVIGVTTLEAMAFGVDPIHQKLIPGELLLM